MKKLKYLVCLVFLVCITVSCFAGCASIAYVKLELEYSPNVTFAVGDEYFDSTLVVYGVTKDGFKRDITADCEIDSSDFNKDVPGGYVIVVKYMELTAEYTVFVGDAIIGLEVSDSKTEYVIGENYTSSGMKAYTVTTKGEKREVTSNVKIDYSAFNKNQAGIYEIVVTYLGITAKYTVTVGEVTQAILEEEYRNTVANTFKRDSAGNFNYEASKSVTLETGEKLTEKVIFSIDMNNDCEYYAEYIIENYELLGRTVYWYMWFEGPYIISSNSQVNRSSNPLETGTLTIKTNSGGNDSVEVTQTTYEMSLSCGSILQMNGYPVTLPMSLVEEFNSGNVIQPISETYEFTNLGNDGYYVKIISTYLDNTQTYQETSTCKFNKGKIYEIDGTEFKFLKDAIGIIPQTPAVD